MSKAERLRQRAEEIEAAERVFKVNAFTVVSQSINYEDADDANGGDWDDDYESGDHTDVNESAECAECGADAEDVLTRHGWTFYAEPQPVGVAPVNAPPPDVLAFLQTIANYTKAAWAENADQQRTAFALSARELLARVEK